MRTSRVLQHVLAATAGLSVYTAALADNCSGRVNNVAISAETIEVAEGHSMVVFAAYSITTSENSANNASGKCGGYAISTPDGKTRSVGVCARRTKDGDSWSDEWVLEPGAERGTWKQSGGTGVFAGKSWSGWWKPVSDDGKVFMGLWGGNCD
jgi:hypothetical protein